MTNWKTFKIIDKADTSGECVRNYLDFDVVALDGNVVFSDKTRDGIFLVNAPPFQDWKIGDYIEIDLDAVRRYPWSWNFGDTNIVRKVGSSTNMITTRGSSSDIVISPSAVNAMNSPNAMDLARRMSEMVDATGKEYEFKIEDSGGLKYSLICRKSNQ